MSLKKWTAGALAGLTLGLLGMSIHAARADEGQREHTRVDVVWLGSLSTGYVVGQEVTRREDMQIVYTRVPINHMVMEDAFTGCILWEGRPHIGQVFHFDKRTHVKFTLWSAPPTEWPPLSPQAGAIANFPHERPILDAMQLQEVRDPVQFEGDRY